MPSTPWHDSSQLANKPRPVPWFVHLLCYVGIYKYHQYRYTGMSQEMTDNIERIGSKLQQVGYTVDVYPSMDMLKVYDPSDTESMYNRVNEVCDSFDVSMTSPTIFQVTIR